jgi:hypothetical protein
MATLKTKKLYIFPLLALLLLLPGVASADFITDTLYSIVVSVFGSFAGLGGLILNYSINNYVVGFGDHFSTGGVGVAVNTLWTVVRDLFNLTFIFGLLYIGFRMILDSENSNTRRWLAYLIIAALLVNFSLYITKVVVDFSNILATQIVVNGFAYTTDPITNVAKVDVSGSFMSSLGIQELFSIKSIPTDIEGGGGAFGYIFGSAIIFIVMAFVFAAGGFLLIIRYAVLVLYMILSPLMFLGWVFPQLQSFTTKYWTGFLGRAFFAPIYILMLYFADTIIRSYYNYQEVTTGGDGPAYTQVFGSGGGSSVEANFGNTIPPFILACIFLIAALIISQKMGAQGATTAVNMGRNISNRAKQVVQRQATRAVRGGAMVATAPVRAGARRASNAVGTSLDRTLTRLQQSNTLGALARTNVVDRAVRGTAASAKNAKYGMAHTAKEDADHRAATEKRYTDKNAIDAGQEAERQNQSYDRDTQIIDVHSGEVVERSMLNPDQLARAEEAQNARDESVAKMQSTINDLSAKQLEEMYLQQPERFAKIVGSLKNNQFDKLMEGDLDDASKGKIFGARQKAITSVVEQNGVVLNEELGKLSTQQIEVLGASWIRKNAHHLTQTQMDDLLKNSKSFTDQQKSMFKANRKTNQEAALKPEASVQDRQGLFLNTAGSVDTGTRAADGSAIYAPKFEGKDGKTKAKKPAEIAALPPSVLLATEERGGVHVVRQDVLDHINAAVLEEIYTKKTLDAAQRDTLRDSVLQYGTADAKKYLESEIGRRNWNNPKP